jgi:ribosome biogenesis GTPase
MDTAGFNLLEPEKQLEPEKLKERYPEFREYEGKCRFRECLHDREPGCAVTEAVAQGKLNARRVERYRQLLEETREIWRTRYD